MAADPSVPTVPELAATWRAEAEGVAPYNEGAAFALRKCAAALEESMRAAALEPLSLDRAAAESGYASDTLRRMVAAGRIRNAGRKNAPRIARGDLPKKGKASTATLYDVDADARRVAAA